MPRPVPLRREIIAILVVKLALIVAIKLAFFSDPPRPGSDGTAALLAAPAAPASPAIPNSARSIQHD